MAESESEEEELFPIDQGETLNENCPALSYGDPKSFSGLIKAVICNSLDDVRRLIELGRSPNINDNVGNTPLHIAVLLQRVQIVDYLLSLEEVRVNARNFWGQTPLYLSLYEAVNNTEICLKLMKAGADVNIANYEDITPLHCAILVNPQVSLALVHRGAALDVQDFNGDTPLHKAVAQGHLEMVSMLLYHNADATIPNNSNMTAFMFSIVEGNRLIQEQLIEYEVDFNMVKKGDDCLSTLFLAIIHHSELCADIIYRGADLDFGHNEVNALTLSMAEDNFELFKVIWDRMEFIPLPYHTEDYVMPQRSILIYPSMPEQYEFCVYMIESQRVGEVVPFLEHEALVKFILEQMLDVSQEKAEQLICILLSHGLEPQQMELEVVFKMCGYSELFRILLHMDLRKSGFRGSVRRLLARIIYDIEQDWSLNDIIHLFFNLHHVWTVDEVKEAVDYCCNRELYQHILARLPEQQDGGALSVDLELRRKLKRQVPSLLELSRNEARNFLIAKFNMNTSRQFYTVVQQMDIPDILKRIITFKVKLYL